MFKETLKYFGYEQRSAYRDAIVEHLTNAANSDVTSTATAALEAVAGIVGRAFAGSTVQGNRTEPLTPLVLNAIGRGLIRKSEVVFYIKAGKTGVRLYPVSACTIEGNYDSDTWQYELTLPGPTREATVKNVSYQNVIHLRTNVEAGSIWSGNPPTSSASLSSRLLTALETALGDESAGPSGSILPVPGASVDELKTSLKNSRGNIELVENTSGYNSGGAAPRNDLSVNRFGFNAPQSQVEARMQAEESIINACGASAALFRSRDATSAQQAYRMLSYSLIEPLAKIVSYELSEKLDSKITFSFPALERSDISNKAGAFQRLASQGMDLERALAISGLMVSE